MRKTREILRLIWSCNQSRRDTARTCSVGKSTVDATINRATAAGLSVDFILALLADITERKRAESDLLAERQYLTDIIDFLPDATFIIDTDQRVVVWNRAAEAMTGVKRNDLLGKGDHAYAVPFYGERRPILIDLLNISEKERESSYSHINRAGNKVYAETFIQTLNEGQGAYLWGVDRDYA